MQERRAPQVGCSLITQHTVSSNSQQLSGGEGPNHQSQEQRVGAGPAGAPRMNAAPGGVCVYVHVPVRLGGRVDVAAVDVLQVLGHKQRTIERGWRSNNDTLELEQSVPGTGWAPGMNEGVKSRPPSPPLAWRCSSRTACRWARQRRSS